MMDRFWLIFSFFEVCDGNQIQTGLSLKDLKEKHLVYLAKLKYFQDVFFYVYLEHTERCQCQYP
jgi:hypothetical protein